MRARNPNTLQRYRDNDQKKCDIPGSYFSLCANDVVIE